MDWYSAGVPADGTVPSDLVPAQKRGTWVGGKLSAGGPPGMLGSWALAAKGTGVQTAAEQRAGNTTHAQL